MPISVAAEPSSFQFMGSLQSPSSADTITYPHLTGKETKVGVKFEACSVAPDPLSHVPCSPEAHVIWCATNP